LIADNLNWLIAENPERMAAQIKIRSAQQEFPAEIIPHADHTIEAHFAEPQKAVTRGQSVVVYDGDYVLGGGVISEAL
jgi:tRNA-specific 2-thiouridylase